MATGKKYNRDLKTAVALVLEEGEATPEALAKKYKVSVQSIQKWKRQFGTKSGPIVKLPGKRRKADASPAGEAVMFLELAEKAIFEEIAAGKRKRRLALAETYLFLALNTLRGA